MFIIFTIYMYSDGVDDQLFNKIDCDSYNSKYCKNVTHIIIIIKPTPQTQYDPIYYARLEYQNVYLHFCQYQIPHFDTRSVSLSSGNDI